MNRQQKRIRNRATNCGLCSEPMTLADRDLYVDTVAHPTCIQDAKDRYWAQVRESSERFNTMMERYYIRVQARETATRLGLWIPGTARLTR